MPRVVLYGTPPQREMVFCDAPVQVWVAGRRWGKTFTARNKMIRAACERPGRKVWYVSPTYGLGREQYDEFTENPAIQGMVRRGRYGPKQGLQPFPRIQLWNRSEISFRSADRPTNLRGGGLDDLFVDEAAWIRPETVWETLRPKLSDRRGRLHLLSTFRGKNWFHDWYEKGLKPGGPEGAQSFYYPSPTGLIFQGADGERELTRARAQVTAAIWEQEYLCKPQANSSGALKFIAQCIGGRIQDGPVKGHSYILGWDTGKTTDPSAFCVLDATDGLVVWSETLELGTPYDRQTQRAIELAKKWRAIVVVDSTGAGTRDAIVDFIRGRVENALGVHLKGRNQEQIVNQLDLDMQQKRLTIPAEFKQLIRECMNYEYEYQGHHLTFGAPDGEHDDHVNALALANWARNEGWAEDPDGRSLKEALL